MHGSSVWEYFLSEGFTLVLETKQCRCAGGMSGLKLSDIIVTLCSKLLDYILLKSGSIILFY